MWYNDRIVQIFEVSDFVFLLKYIFNQGKHPSFLLSHYFLTNDNNYLLCIHYVSGTVLLSAFHSRSHFKFSQPFGLGIISSILQIRI